MLRLREALGDLRERGLRRTPDQAAPAGAFDLCSNDYLGFAREAWPVRVRASSGAGASRLVAPSHTAHVHAERALADWVGLDTALMFSSGYAANVGLLSCLAQTGDVIVSDVLNHASIIDGCRLSRARTVVVPHLSTEAVRAALEEARGARRRVVVTEAVFSMEGDRAPLRDLRNICDELGAALIVDEAHALGVLGPSGAGLSRELDVQPDAVVGTLGKAVGLQGAFVAGSELLRHYLWSCARSFVFSTGISPALAEVTSTRVEAVRSADARRAVLARRVEQLRSAVPAVAAHAVGAIVPWVVGDANRAVALSRTLGDRGVHARAIRPPTVPAGTSRIRLTATAGGSDAEYGRAVDVVREACAGLATADG